MRVEASKAASLARINMTREELETLQKDLDEMMELFEKLLQDEEVVGLEPMYTPTEVSSASREDLPEEPLGEGWMKLVPRREGGYVKSPRP